MDESLLHLFYLYKNSSKKVRELKNLYQILKEQFETYGNNIRPVMSNGTSWIDLRIRAMEKLVNKFGLYMQHIQNITPDTTKQLDCVKLQGKFSTLIESNVILQAAFLLDILEKAKIFNLCTQKVDTNIIDITDAAQSIQRHYNQLKKSSTKILSFFLCYQPWRQFCRKLRKTMEKKHNKIKGLMISQGKRLHPKPC